MAPDAEPGNIDWQTKKLEREGGAGRQGRPKEGTINKYKHQRDSGATRGAKPKIFAKK